MELMECQDITPFLKNGRAKFMHDGCEFFIEPLDKEYHCPGAYLVQSIVGDLFEFNKSFIVDDYGNGAIIHVDSGIYSANLSEVKNAVIHICDLCEVTCDDKEAVVLSKFYSFANPKYGFSHKLVDSAFDLKSISKSSDLLTSIVKRIADKLARREGTINVYGVDKDGLSVKYEMGLIVDSRPSLEVYNNLVNFCNNELDINIWHVD